MKSYYRGEFFRRRKLFLSTKFKTSLRQILTYLWEYKKLFTFIITLGLLQSILFLTIPLFLGPILDILVDPSIPITNVIPTFTLLIFIQGIVAILFGVRIYVNRWVGANIIYNIRNDLFATIQMMSYGWLDKMKTGDLLSRTTSDVDLLKEFLGNNFQFFIRQAFTFSFSFLVLFLINVELAFYVLVISPALFYVLFMFRKKMRPAFRKSRESYSDLTHRVQENVQGIKIVKSFATEEYEINKFKGNNDEYFDDSVKIVKLQATFDPIIYLIDNFAFLIVILIGGVFVFGGRMSFGDLISFILVMNFSVEPLYYISRFLANLPQISETCDRVTYILNSEILVKEKENAIEIPEIKGEIEFKNVYFAFNSEEEHYVLKNINFKINPGENVAILGATGSGKSALVKLIPRFYDINKGEILIDGVNVKDVKFRSLRKQIGYVSQERLLFSRSIRDNIAFGDREMSDEMVKNAAIASDINKFIEHELPKKYETKVGERGTTLSGGEKQRVAIARALAIKPKILILDDCFSSVDVDTEYNIQQHFREVFKECTTFLITQRLSTVRHADRIIVLNNGEIDQIGSHEELMKDIDGIYRKLYLTLKVEERA